MIHLPCLFPQQYNQCTDSEKLQKIIIRESKTNVMLYKCILGLLGKVHKVCFNDDPSYCDDKSWSVRH